MKSLIQQTEEKIIWLKKQRDDEGFMRSDIKCELEYLKEVLNHLKAERMLEEVTIPYLKELCNKREDLLLSFKEQKEKEIEMIDKVINDD